MTIKLKVVSGKRHFICIIFFIGVSFPEAVAIIWKNKKNINGRSIFLVADAGYSIVENFDCLV